MLKTLTKAIVEIAYDNGAFNRSLEEAENELASYVIKQLKEIYSIEQLMETDCYLSRLDNRTFMELVIGEYKTIDAPLIVLDVLATAFDAI